MCPGNVTAIKVIIWVTLYLLDTKVKPSEQYSSHLRETKMEINNKSVSFITFIKCKSYLITNVMNPSKFINAPDNMGFAFEFILYSCTYFL